MCQRDAALVDKVALVISNRYTEFALYRTSFEENCKYLRWGLHPEKYFSVAVL
jgi:hypothetical protein